MELALSNGQTVQADRERRNCRGEEHVEAPWGDDVRCRRQGRQADIVDSLLRSVGSRRRYTRISMHACIPPFNGIKTPPGILDGITSATRCHYPTVPLSFSFECRSWQG